MYAYFPEIYPDESLYSVLARLRTHLGGLPSMQFQRWLYGDQSHPSDFELVGGINVIALNAYGASQSPLDALIDYHTGLNYHLRFQEDALAESSRRMYASGEVRGLLLWTGFTATRSGRLKRLRYCAQCLQIMNASYGECYWRRAHNLPGTLVCPDHGCTLSLSSADLSRCGRFEFISADMTLCSAHDELVFDFPPEVLPLAQKLAKVSAGFLTVIDHYQSYVEWTADYMVKIRALGLMRGSMIDDKRLALLVSDVYSGIYPYLKNCLNARGDGVFPFRCMLQKPSSGFRPLDHALMQVFLSCAGSPRILPPSRVTSLREAEHYVIDAGYIRPCFKDLEDWGAIDCVLRDAVLLIVDRIRSERPPVRISRSQIERRLPAGGRIGKRLQHLPKTAEVLRQYVETVQDFQSRRVRWHISEFVRLGRPITTAAILKVSSIRFAQRSRVEQLMAEFTHVSGSEAVADLRPLSSNNG